MGKTAKRTSFKTFFTVWDNRKNCMDATRAVPGAEMKSPVFIGISVLQGRKDSAHDRVL